MADRLRESMGGKESPPSKATEPPETPPASPPSPPLEEKKTAPPKAEPKPSPAPVPETKAEPKPEPKPESVGMAELRRVYGETKHKLESREAEFLKTLTEKEQSWASKEKEFQDLVADREKRLKEIKDKLDAIDYANSDEYKERFIAPVEAIYASAAEVVQSLPVESQDRAGTIEDLKAIFGNTNPVTARKIARELFGEGASDVMQYYNNWRIESRKAEEALRNHHQRISQQAESDRIAREAKEQREQAALKAVWEKAVSDISASDPMFQTTDDDADGSALLQAGLAEVDQSPSQDMTTQVIRLAKARMKVAAYDRLKAHTDRLAKRISELEEELKNVTSGPIGGEAGGEQAVRTEETMADRIRKAFATPQNV